jgi:hypothetical protein
MENFQAQQIEGSQGSIPGEIGEPEEMQLAIAEH